MNKFSKVLVKSLGDARNQAEGRAASARVHVVKVPNVRAIRRKAAFVAAGIRPEISNPSANTKKLGAGKAAT